MPAKSDTAAPSPEAHLASFIAKLDPKTQTVFRSLRTELRKRFPSANEVVYDYSFALVIGYAPADKGIDAILAIRASDAGVSLYFSQGPKLSDPKRLLKGSGKQTRFITVESAAQLADPDVEAFLRATVAQARIPFPSTGKGSIFIKSDSATKTTRKKIAGKKAVAKKSVGKKAAGKKTAGKKTAGKKSAGKKAAAKKTSK